VSLQVNFILSSVGNQTQKRVSTVAGGAGRKNTSKTLRAFFGGVKTLARKGKNKMEKPQREVREEPKSLTTRAMKKREKKACQGFGQGVAPNGAHLTFDEPPDIRTSRLLSNERGNMVTGEMD